MKQEITKSIEKAEQELREKQIEEMARDICPFSNQYENCKMCDTELDTNNEDCIYRTMAKPFIKQDYRKQVEAEWIPTMKYYVGLPIYKCSKCNRETETPKKDYYCPNCGAKMKGN